jgi:hypothetical protein
VTETCSGYAERSFCVVSASGLREWKTEKCSAGCFSGKCAADACVDECALGMTTSKGTCRLWDMKAKSFVDATPATSMHDRARDYDQRLRTTNLKFGQVVNVSYTEASLATVSKYSGYRDAAIWTGSALAAQAWRLATTRSPDAEAQVQAFVKTLHHDFEVTGTPGYHARFVIPANDPIPLRAPRTCGSEDWICNSAGSDWSGGTSRDQYTGVMLGYLAAYLVTVDEATRAVIRKDVVAVVKELMKKQTVPVRIVVNGIALDKTVELENVILSPNEMKDGRVVASIGTGDVADSEMQGMREFVPDFSMIVKPILGIGTKIPRDSTAIMIGAFFEMALLVSADDPQMATDRAAIETYYKAHVQDWLDIAEKWSFSTRDGCGQGYFATHITYIMAWAWAAIANDPTIASRIRDDVLDERMWSAVKTHKNSYFAFMWGSTRGTPDPQVLASALDQLGQFEAGPRIRHPRNSLALSKYEPHDPSCPNQTDQKTNATDVKDRRVDDFIWQRQPWELYEGGDPTIVFPGVDYLAAYWIARRYDMAKDDRPGTCARFDGP